MCEEVEELKRKIEALMALIGDTNVADQIAIAIKNIIFFYKGCDLIEHKKITNFR